MEHASVEQLKGTFPGAALWQRTLIVLAGPLANLLIAVVIIAAFAVAYGRPEVGTTVVDFLEKSDAQQAGIQRGDRLIAFDGRNVETPGEVAELAVLQAGKTVSVSLIRNGTTMDVPVKLSTQDLKDRFGNEMKFGDLGIDYAEPVVIAVNKGSPAGLAGIEVGDRILAIGTESIDGFADIRRAVSTRPGQAVAVKVQRGTAELVVNAKLDSVKGLDDQGRPVQVGQIGILAGKVVPVGIIQSIGIGFEQSVSIMRNMITGLKQIIVGDRSVKELGGPLKIAKFSGERLSMGWLAFVDFAALISINLAFINLLPIPTLDGGHLAMYAAEAVRRKPLGVRSQEWAFRGGLALVLGLAVFVTFNDVASMFFN
jgi:regulator of sigma E protease